LDLRGRKEAEGWRILQNEELHKLYSSPNIIQVINSRRIKWAGYVASMGEMRNAYNIFVVKHDGNRPLGRPRRRWEGNIRMDLREIGGRVWIDCIWLRVWTSGGPL
jgi:hypothetical protein